jgi:hypothetical protein
MEMKICQPTNPGTRDHRKLTKYIHVTTDPTAKGPTATGPQPYKVESNNTKQHPVNQEASTTQPTRNVGEEQYWPNSLHTRLYQKIQRKMYCNTSVNQIFQVVSPVR